MPAAATVNYGEGTMKKATKAKKLEIRPLRAGVRRAMGLQNGMSILTLTAFGFAGAAGAQQAPAASSAPDASASDLGSVVVVGIRRALETAQQVKMDADTVMDSIDATDIGAFPDKS